MRSLRGWWRALPLAAKVGLGLVAFAAEAAAGYLVAVGGVHFLAPSRSTTRVVQVLGARHARRVTPTRVIVRRVVVPVTMTRTVVDRPQTATVTVTSHRISTITRTVGSGRETTTVVRTVTAPSLATAAREVRTVTPKEPTPTVMRTVTALQPTTLVRTTTVVRAAEPPPPVTVTTTLPAVTVTVPPGRK
jgi:hypothetical protein